MCVGSLSSSFHFEINISLVERANTMIICVMHHEKERVNLAMTNQSNKSESEKTLRGPPPPLFKVETPSRKVRLD